MRSSPEPLALATLIRASGSSFRKPGAMALVNPARVLAGGVSAGCLEHEAALAGRRALESGEPQTLRFCLDEKSGGVFGYGLACGGSGEILLEPLTPEHRSAMARLEDLLVARKPAVLARNPFLRPPKVFLWTENGERQPDIAASLFENALEDGAALHMPENWLLQAFYPPPRLFLFGATALSLSLARMAAEAGFEPLLLDWRAGALGSAAPLPSVPWDDFKGNPGAAPPDAFDSAVILSHHLERDREALAHFALLPLAYLGALGSRKRIEELTRGLPAPARRLDAPAGLDLGADAPEEVALSILAGILLVLRRGPDAPPRKLCRA